MVFSHKDGSIFYEYGQPIHYINFFFGSLEGAKDPENFPNRRWEFKKSKHHREREVRVQFYNISKIIYKIPCKIQRSKLAFLNYGCESSRFGFNDIINCNSNVNFNYIAYDGIVVKPEEIFFRDKGIRIDLTRKEQPKMIEENLPDLWGLTID